MVPTLVVYLLHPTLFPSVQTHRSWYLGVTGLTSLMNTVLSDTLGVTGLTSLVNTVLSESDKFMVDSSGNVSAVGTLCLPALASSVMTANPIANKTYQEFMTIANSSSSRLSGGVVSVSAEVKKKLLESTHYG